MLAGASTKEANLAPMAAVVGVDVVGVAVVGADVVRTSSNMRAGMAAVVAAVVVDTTPREEDTTALDSRTEEGASSL
jgi:ABC-type proline/glycine betaine transport system permease subunit